MASDSGIKNGSSHLTVGDWFGVWSIMRPMNLYKSGWGCSHSTAAVSASRLSSSCRMLVSGKDRKIWGTRADGQKVKPHRAMACYRH